jgi:pimeloyl-ACP methyl ester carboxylesterase
MFGIAESMMFPGSPDVLDKSLPIINLSYKLGIGVICTSLESFGKEHIEKFPCLCYEPQEIKYNILFFHGNSCNLNTISPLASWISKSYKSRFICPEYKGYATRSGKASEDDCQRIAIATINYILKTWNEPIIVVGHSIGTGTAAYIASLYQDKIKALALISPYSSIKNLAYDIAGIANIFVSNMFPTIDRVKDFNNKIIFIHGDEDDIIGSHHSKLLYENCSSNNKKILIYRDYGHNDLPWDICVFTPIFSFINE